MFDSSFFSMERELKEEKMRKIIKMKAKNISDKHVNEILHAINLDKQYGIVCVYDMPTFIRNAHREIGDSFEVSVTPIYGDICPGIVTAEGDYEEPTMSDEPSAILKSARIMQHGKEYHEDNIIIYEVLE